VEKWRKNEEKWGKMRKGEERWWGKRKKRRKEFKETGQKVRESEERSEGKEMAILEANSGGCQIFEVRKFSENSKKILRKF